MISAGPQKLEKLRQYRVPTDTVALIQQKQESLDVG